MFIFKASYHIFLVFPFMAICMTKSNDSLMNCWRFFIIWQWAMNTVLMGPHGWLPISINTVFMGKGTLASSYTKLILYFERLLYSNIQERLLESSFTPFGEWEPDPREVECTGVHVPMTTGSTILGTYTMHNTTWAIFIKSGLYFSNMQQSTLCTSDKWLDP